MTDKRKSFYTSQDLFVGAEIHVGLPISRMQVEIGEEVIAICDPGVKYVSVVKSKDRSGFIVEIKSLL